MQVHLEGDGYNFGGTFECAEIEPELWNGWEVPRFTLEQLGHVRAWYDALVKFPDEDWHEFDYWVEAAGDLFTLPGWAFSR
jgi:hypothetical protein